QSAKKDYGLRSQSVAMPEGRPIRSPTIREVPRVILRPAVRHRDRFERGQSSFALATHRRSGCRTVAHQLRKKYPCLLVWSHESDRTSVAPLLFYAAGQDLPN